MENRFFAVYESVDRWKSTPSSSKPGAGRRSAKASNGHASAPLSSSEFSRRLIRFFGGRSIESGSMNGQLQQIAADMLWTAAGATRARSWMPAPAAGKPGPNWLKLAAVQAGFGKARRLQLFEAVRQSIGSKYGPALEVALLNEQPQNGHAVPASSSPSQSISASLSTAVDYQIPGVIPVMAQPSGMTCWATVYTMLDSWRSQKSISITQALQDVGQKWLDKFNANQGLGSAEKLDFIKDTGLVDYEPFNPSIQGWEGMLRQFGPIWVTTNENPGGAWAIHARILIGIKGDGSGKGTKFTIIDPAGGRKYEETVDQFWRKFEDELTKTGHARVQILHWPEPATAQTAYILSLATQMQPDDLLSLANALQQLAQPFALDKEKVKKQIIEAITTYETNRGGGKSVAKESSLETVAGVKASVKSVGQYIVSRAISEIIEHEDLRKLATPELTLEQVKKARTKIQKVASLLSAVENAGTAADQDDFLKKNKTLITASGLSEADVKTMFKALSLKATVDGHRSTYQDYLKTEEGKTKANQKTKRRELAQSIPESDRLGIGVGSLMGYIRVNAFRGENKAAWQRKALAGDEIGKRIIAVATHDGGWSMIKADLGKQVDDLMKADPDASEETLVKAVAKRHNSDASYPPAVWSTYQKLFMKAKPKAKSLSAPFALKASVGTGGTNDKDDVRKLKAHLHGLGYNWIPVNEKMDPVTEKTIRLFQSIINGRSTLGGDGRVDVPGPTYDWLQATNAPRWQQIPKVGRGFKDTDLASGNAGKVAMNWGTNWLVDTIKNAGDHYETNHRKGSKKTALIATNDMSTPQGGPNSDHKGHETGMMVDLKLPHKDGKSGGITWEDSKYDQNATRAMLKAFRAQGLTDKIFFNDPVLRNEGLCSKLSGHDNHIHIRIKPPARQAAIGTIGKAAVTGARAGAVDAAP